MTVSSAGLSESSSKGNRVFGALGELWERERSASDRSLHARRILSAELEKEKGKSHLGPGASLGIGDVLSQDETVLDAEGSGSVGLHVERAGEALVSDPGNSDADGSD